MKPELILSLSLITYITFADERGANTNHTGRRCVYTSISSGTGSGIYRKPDFINQKNCKRNGLQSMDLKKNSTLPETHVKIETLELAERSFTSLIAHFALCTFIAVISPIRTEHPEVLWSFSALIFLVTALRLVICKRAVSNIDQSPHSWRRLLSIGNYISGLLWGLFTVITAVYYNHEWPFMFMLVINCGIVAGATNSLAPSYSLSRIFTFLMLFPTVVWGIYHGTSLGYSVSVLLVFTALMFIKMAKSNYSWYWEGIGNNERIRSQKEQLESIMKGVNEDTGTLNHSSKELSDFSDDMLTSTGQMSEKLKWVMDTSQTMKNSMDSVAAVMNQTTENFNSITDARNNYS